MVMLQEAPTRPTSTGRAANAVRKSLGHRKPLTTTRGWRRFFLPVTYVYSLLLTVVTLLIAVRGDDVRSRIVEHASTNLNNLLRGHLGTLFSSAFVLGDQASAILIIPLLVCVLALAERRLGSARLLRIFLAGHVGATVLVAVGLWVAVVAEWLPSSIAYSEDVGVSYGAMALIGSFVTLLPARWRPTWTISWLAVAGASVVMGRTFTNVGHLLAVAIGLVVGAYLIRSGRMQQARFGRFESTLLGTAAVLGYLLLVG